jgi:hypothetical protein
MDYQAQLNRKKKRYPIKLVNQDNLVYPNKLTNHANPIERQNKKKLQNQILNHSNIKR